MSSNFFHTQQLILKNDLRYPNKQVFPKRFHASMQDCTLRSFKLSSEKRSAAAPCHKSDNYKKEFQSDICTYLEEYFYIIFIYFTNANLMICYVLVC